MPTSPFLFSKPILHLIVLSCQRIGPSRRSRTDRPAYAYKIRIGKFHNTMAKFLSIESFGCHKQILLPGFEKAKSSKSGQILIYGSIPRENVLLQDLNTDGKCSGQFAYRLPERQKSGALTVVSFTELHIKRPEVRITGFLSAVQAGIITTTKLQNARSHHPTCQSRSPSSIAPPANSVATVPL
jgi:hypothetical protein